MENRMKISKKQICIYVIAAFGIAYIVQIIASICALNGNQLMFKLLMGLCMYLPLLAVLIARVPLKGMGWVPHLKGRVLGGALWGAHGIGQL